MRFLFEQPITILTWHTKPGVVISAVLIFVFGLYLTLFNLISVFALNDTNNLWTFNTANAGSYTYDSNLVAIDTSAHPISGVNKFTNPAFASDASSWSVTAVNGSGTPTGWVAVPGNSTYSITERLDLPNKFHHQVFGRDGCRLGSASSDQQRMDDGSPKRRGASIKLVTWDSRKRVFICRTQ